jgi:hypothetical protein
LASTAEIIAIIRALLALSTAAREIQGAITALADSNREEALARLEASSKANEECLEHIQRFVQILYT